MCTSLHVILIMHIWFSNCRDRAFPISFISHPSFSFTPTVLNPNSGAALKERRPDINSDFAGIYPWDWVGDDNASFKAISGGPLVAPILQTLLLNRFPVESLDFADKVSKWKFQRIIPAHLKNNLKFNGADYRKSFGFLEAKGVPKGYPKPLKGDFKLLRDAEVSLVESGAIAEAPPLVGGPFSREEIIAKTTYRCRRGICAQKASL